MSTHTLPQLEARVLARWEEDDTPRRVRESGGEEWTLLEGPPTMNGRPGVHHVEARAAKDLLMRFMRMRGYKVSTRAGWDCHGLPVELAVSKTMGLQGRVDVEALGVERFVELCRESVEEHQGVFSEMTRRMGYWVDLESPWRTMDSAYVEGVWGLLAALHRKGLLVRDVRVTSWCPSCQTALSAHEVAQGYTDAEDETFWVRMELSGSTEGVAVWTTTPWTLPSNQLVGVDPEGEYTLVEWGGRTWVSRVFAEGSGREVLETCLGRDLVGREYSFLEKKGRVVEASFAEVGSGTGLVHLAPAFGGEDLEVGRREGVEVTPAMGPDGVMLGELAGLLWSEAAGRVAELLGESLLERGEVAHRVSGCWRCHERLVALLRPAWYVRTSAVRERMVEENRAVSWSPRGVGEGRFGEWLEGGVDWAVSRERFWGTPLPVWVCASGHERAVSSRRELFELSGVEVEDVHRPSVDEVVFSCSCGEEMRRVEEVVDCWFDAGAAPLVLGMEEVDLVVEGVDQTRGWFYTLHALSVLLRGEKVFSEVLALGHVVDEKGVKMSKHLGNVLDPFLMFERYGADAVRWCLLAEGSMLSTRRVGEGSVAEAARQLAVLWNATLLVSERRAEGSEEGEGGLLERWLSTRVARTQAEVTRALEAREVHLAGGAVMGLVDDLSRTYLRSRREELSLRGVQEVAQRALMDVAVMLAPFAPFLAEAVWEEMGGEGSVHLQRWREGASRGGEDVLAEVEEAWRVVEEGRRLRAQAGVRTRQVLPRLTLRRELSKEARELVRREVNVKEVEVLPGGWRVGLEWRRAGRVLGRDAQRVKELLPAEVARPGSLRVELDGREVELLEELLTFTELRDDVVLDTHLTPALLREGRAADLARRVALARREAGYSRSDEVSVRFSGTLEEEALDLTEELRVRGVVFSKEADLVVE